MDKIFVFDLDFTLWHLSGTWCDCTCPPYKIKNGKVLDSCNAEMNLYPETISILEELKSEGYHLAVASRTDQPDWARELMILLKIDHYFDYKEIYPSSKTKHLGRIKDTSGYNFTQIIFFDDEYRNIADTQHLGVTAIHVKNGITRQLVEKHK
ncbi:MAG: magnesium-dependent phosphatase-1 [Prolixibacteraceae bacterium]|jgi:magnesium-dependent phosphatase 1|nr:magnesium-dependent phosphatase-1 [Prolixibacteraceae bacterium]